MKSYRYLIAVIIALLVITIVLVFKSNNSNFKNRAKEIAIQNTGRIDEIIIRSDTTSVFLRKVKGDNWKLNNTFNAKKEAVKLILGMLERFEIKGPVSRKYQAIVARKLENSGKHVEIYSGNRLIRSFFIDYDSTELQSTIYLGSGAKKPFIIKLKGYSLSDISLLFSPEIRFWRDNTLFGYQATDISAIQVEYPDKKNQSFKIVMKSGKLPELTNPFSENKIENPDYKSLHDYLYFFTNIKYQRPDSNISSSLTNKMLFATILIAGKSNDSLQVRLYKIPVNRNLKNGRDDNMNWCYGRIGNETEAVLIKYGDIDPVLREMHDFLKK